MSALRVVVIGGGAAGIFAASRAAQCGADVTLLEKGIRLGLKLRITGKGRANISNSADLPEFIKTFGPNGKFLFSAFSRFFRDDLMELLQTLGVPTKIERGGRVFPESDKAGDVADALERWMRSCGVNVQLNARVKSIEHKDDIVFGVNLYNKRIDADAIVIATGGASYPKTGSTGDGYEMARKLGHTLVPPAPALSALRTKERWVSDLAGLSLRNVQATLFTEDASGSSHKIASEFGEMIVTHTGVSGPIILTLSREVGSLLKQGRVYISIDLKPALSSEQVHSRLIRDFRQNNHFKNYLRELLPSSLIHVFLHLSGIDPDKPVNSITTTERERIVELLKDFRVTVTAMAPLDEAIVTAGGVSIKEIDPKTMMSKLVKGLFFAGEVIDIDAATGGYNLQAAFSTGYVAGQSAGEYTTEAS